MSDSKAAPAISSGLLRGSPRNAIRAAAAGVLALACPWLLQAQTGAGATPLLRALESYRLGECSQAIPLFEGILLSQPKNIRVRKLLASCQSREGLTEEARQNYLTILEVMPGDPEASRALQAPQRAAAASSAPAQPKPVAKPQPPPPSRESVERARGGETIAQAERMIEAKRWNEAEPLLEALAQRMPEAILPRQRLAEIYSGSERYQRAAETYASLAGQEGEESAFALRAAQNFSWAAAYTSATEWYGRYLAGHPNDRDARLGMANALLWSNELERAAETYREYLKAVPDDLDARLNLGRALLWSENAADALEQIRLVQRRRPGDPAVAFAIGRCHETMGEADDALAFYRDALHRSPEFAEAREAIARVNDEAPLYRAYRSVQSKEYGRAAEAFLEYYSKHPHRDEVVLQAARAYSWDEQFSDAALYYQRYLDKHPEDEQAIRELAQVEMSRPDFEAARAHYVRLIAGSNPKIADREGLVRANLWSANFEDAEAASRGLLQVDPENEVGLEALREAATRGREQLLAEARASASEKRYPQALNAYHAYAEKYGAEREVELAMCRVYSWDRQWANATLAYQDYLQRHPDDTQARTELAQLQQWSGQYAAAEAEYRALTEADASNTQALLGLAQVSSYRGDDAFEVARRYRTVLEVDPSNVVAQEGYEELGPRVSPSFAYNLRTFGDSDDFGLSSNTFEAAFPSRGGLKVAPFYRYDYFNQFRQVGGTACGSNSALDPRNQLLSDQVCGADGIARAHVGGLRVDLAGEGRVSFRGEVAGARFDTDRSSLQAQGQLFVRSGENSVFGLSFTRRDAAYDVRTVSPVFAGIVGDSAALSFQTPLSRRWRFWATGGATRYSESLDQTFSKSTQAFASAQLDYHVSDSFTAGYFFRLTGFNEPSPLYFSPRSYGTFGGIWRWAGELSRDVRLSVDAELGYGRIHRYDLAGQNTVEVVFYPALSWRIQPDLGLSLGYRYGRGSNSAFRSSAYRTNVLEFRLETSFMDRFTRQNEPGLVIR